jgi:hypothetical protein
MQAAPGVIAAVLAAMNERLPGNQRAPQCVELNDFTLRQQITPEKAKRNRLYLVFMTAPRNAISATSRHILTLQENHGRNGIYS